MPGLSTGEESERWRCRGSSFFDAAAMKAAAAAESVGGTAAEELQIELLEVQKCGVLLLQRVHLYKRKWKTAAAEAEATCQKKMAKYYRLNKQNAILREKLAQIKVVSTTAAQVEEFETLKQMMEQSTGGKAVSCSALGVELWRLWRENKISYAEFNDAYEVSAAYQKIPISRYAGHLTQEPQNI